MSFGKLTTPIVIKKITYTTDADGFRIPHEKTVASVHAYFEPRNSTEKWTNRAVLKEASALFRFRYIPHTTIDTSMVIDCIGERYNLISVENVRQKNMYYEAIGKLEVESDGNHEAENA
ncbi:MAG: head-tail adaptor protein [Lachnospiraceae bacterium]|nr:head-tail adaptor protein [Lachnospiraceae bacterium]